MTELSSEAGKPALTDALDSFVQTQKIRGKGPLAVMLVVNEHARDRGLPLDPNALLTEQGGQVLGLGKGAVQTILARHGITRVLAEEGGRTSRGSIANMKAYVAFLNAWFTSEGFDLGTCEHYWIGRVEAFFAGKPFVLRLDSSWGVRTAIRHLVSQAVARQKEGTGTMFVGTLMQHMVGAKLEVALGRGLIEHHSSNQSDQNPSRHGDFDLEDVAIHVSTAPSEALIRKCQANLGKGKRPLIVTTFKGMLTAEGLLENVGIADRVDLIEFEQFIATNVFELGKFSSVGRTDAFMSIVTAYNLVIDRCETDPSLRVEMTSGK